MILPSHPNLLLVLAPFLSHHSSSLLPCLSPLFFSCIFSPLHIRSLASLIPQEDGCTGPAWTGTNPADICTARFPDCIYWDSRTTVDANLCGFAEVSGEFNQIIGTLPSECTDPALMDFLDKIVNDAYFELPESTTDTDISFPRGLLDGGVVIPANVQGSVSASCSLRPVFLEACIACSTSGCDFADDCLTAATILSSVSRGIGIQVSISVTSAPGDSVGNSGRSQAQSLLRTLEETPGLGASWVVVDLVDSTLSSTPAQNEDFFTEFFGVIYGSGDHLSTDLGPLRIGVQLTATRCTAALGGIDLRTLMCAGREFDSDSCAPFVVWASHNDGSPSPWFAANPPDFTSSFCGFDSFDAKLYTLSADLASDCGLSSSEFVRPFATTAKLFDQTLQARTVWPAQQAIVVSGPHSEARQTCLTDELSFEVLVVDCGSASNPSTNCQLWSDVLETTGTTSLPYRVDLLFTVDADNTPRQEVHALLAELVSQPFSRQAPAARPFDRLWLAFDFGAAPSDFPRWAHDFFRELSLAADPLPLGLRLNLDLCRSASTEAALNTGPDLRSFCNQAAKDSACAAWYYPGTSDSPPTAPTPLSSDAGDDAAFGYCGFTRQEIAVFSSGLSFSTSSLESCDGALNTEFFDTLDFIAMRRVLRPPTRTYAFPRVGIAVPSADQALVSGRLGPAGPDPCACVGCWADRGHHSWDWVVRWPSCQH